jgi:hypothetical protein
MLVASASATPAGDSQRVNPATCPCCGYLTLSKPGTYEICPICFWEDDPSQLRLLTTSGANHISLIDGQNNFIAFGACERRVLEHCRAPGPDDRRDPAWRPVELDLDRVVTSRMDSSLDPTALYYWRRLRPLA